MIPALGYLLQYERLIEKDRQGTLTTAEVQILLSSFDQAELHSFEQARELTITLLKTVAHQVQVQELGQDPDARPEGDEQDARRTGLGDRHEAQRSDAMAFPLAGDLDGSAAAGTECADRGFLKQTLT